MAELTEAKMQQIIGALYATIAVHEQTIAEQSARIAELSDALEKAQKQSPSLLE